MKKIFYWLLLLPLITYGQQNTGALSLKGELVPGSYLMVQYDPQKGPLKDEPKIFVNVSFVEGARQQGQTILLKMQQGVWQTSITIPGKITFLGLQFHNNNGTEDEKRYLFKIAGGVPPMALLTEKDYDFYILFYTQFDHKQQVDSLEYLRKLKYPDGNWLKAEYFHAFLSAATLQDMNAALKKMLVRFPALFSDPSYPKEKFYQPMAQKAAEIKQWQSFTKYAERLSPLKRAYLKSQVAYDLFHEKSDLPRAERLAMDAIGELNKPAYKKGFLRPGTSMDSIEFGNDVEFNYILTVINYGYIAYGNHHFREALPALKYVTIDLFEKKDQRSYELYLKILANVTESETALKAFENYYAAGDVSSDDLNILFRKLYNKVHHNTGGFDKYFEEYAYALWNATKKGLLNEQLHQPSVDFTLPDQNGHMVRLADLKGKTVVLDYWATWCVFCKKAFPAMEKIIQKYKGDTSVVFLFIDSQESNPDFVLRKQQILPYLATNHFNFQVLFDEKNGDSYNAYTDYSISALPTKFVIDPQGFIVFKEVGFNGSDDELQRKLSLMIELSKIKNANSGDKIN